MPGPRRPERVPQDARHVHGVEQRGGQETPRAGADERDRVEGETAGQCGNAKQPNTNTSHPAGIHVRNAIGPTT
jgi:hypothetical protein